LDLQFSENIINNVRSKIKMTHQTT